ncbi:hypothetical protein GAQ78_15370 [Bacteroides uniformis]|jgi:hypothetical protein|uniref:hypothetical protein n=1 Tax=Bacteroidaceae TaxID=815 RepID=UPI00125DE26E|nr:MULTISPECIES: hypothetical protein [Bacteroidaceae]KAB3915342.1 hypothetical protein GAS08_15285 [Bacteroides uniformis]KAB3917919.1 hypothetical protein GAS31_14295 [Bacteroides uniformis]KAB4017491.1 hypothetical protein GAQ74_14450 [Bacteroides uniformis]KAB4028821.1 hypothetical protein GAQ78_15370 [Bacteroides uniformis]MCG0361908.1 hypothetical protein [Phocaeicola vulgatus]
MEYYGKILCISYNDLTYDDRPVMVNGKADYSRSRTLKGVHPSTLSEEELAPIMSIPNYKKLAAKEKINVVRSGRGLGGYVLVEIATMPLRFQERIKLKYGDMKEDVIRNWLGSHYHIDAKAREFYTRFRFDNGDTLPPEHIQEYTVNASVIEAVMRAMEDATFMRKAMKAGPVNWGELAGAISYYQAEFGHTLPVSSNRFKKRVNDFKANGYESLISRKFMNQNRRKVTYDIERLLLSIDAQPEQPFNTTVWEQYNLFVQGELELYDPETGEVLNPADFTDKDGNPLVLSPATVANYLNNPKNKALRGKLHMSQWDFNNAYRPYHLRSIGEYSLSKVSLDDRDLPRPMKDGNRVKAYYAYDVVSGAVVGYAYNRYKTTELFLDCMRNMFQTLDRNGMYIPAELEVEHHLVSDFADGLMQAGTVFPLIRWCNPGNSREKRAEHKNREKKYGVEKRTQVGIGRWYAKLEANRPKEEKVYDEKNNTYKVKTYSYEELVADDIRAIETFNAQPHPNQKRYPGMSRWDVLCAHQNPNLAPWDKAVLYRFIGQHTETTIRQNTYCTVMYNQYGLPSPEIIEKLEPRNYKVDAYYLPDADGTINEIYIYQNGRYIATCKPVARYNENTAEQTEYDKAAYTEQSKYVAQFDKMMKDGKIKRVGILAKEEAKLITEVQAEAVPLPAQAEEEDYSAYMDISAFEHDAVAKI